MPAKRSAQRSQRRNGVARADLGQHVDRGRADIGMRLALEQAAQQSRSPARPAYCAPARSPGCARRNRASASSAAMKGAIASGSACSASIAAAALAGILRAQIGQQRLHARLVADRASAPVMMASRTRGIGFAGERRGERRRPPRRRPPSARAARHRVSASGLRSAAICDAESSAGSSPAPDGAVPRLTKGMRLPPCRRSPPAISSTGRTSSAPPFFTSSPGMPQTTAVDSASAMVRPPCLAQPRHRVGAVVAHAGHQHADQAGGAS